MDTHFLPLQPKIRFNAVLASVPGLSQQSALAGNNCFNLLHRSNQDSWKPRSEKALTIDPGKETLLNELGLNANRAKGKPRFGEVPPPTRWVV